MKRPTNLFLIAILVMLVAIVSLQISGRKTTVIIPEAAANTSSVPQLRIQVQALQPLAQVQPTPAVAAAIEPAPAAVAAPQADASEAVKTSANEKQEYTAVSGDTLSNVAVGLLGSDSKKNRDAVAAANPALRADPDRVLAGKTYLLTAPDTVSSEPAPAEVQSAPLIPAPQAAVATPPRSDRELKYTAKTGDTVSSLAAGLLGGDSKINRDAIINQNGPLQQDPDLILAGKTYKIPADNGLSAAPGSATTNLPRPTTQPDADEVVKAAAGRELRYTARAGDNVSKLAKILLGSDTQINREAIIRNNASLKSDPDRVVVGQVYWITAPTASVETR